ncbi:methionine/alanine import family NSS transporter small subunit [Avibacterium paragallinarum]
MSTSAIIMMAVALVIIWGGLIYAIKALPKEKN